ncbi:Uncharacterised protein [Mycobacteroides abscessus subsp. massiliense]|uniref:hypothetical protein n=1 Tax=Mycobacteroides abscessus TaxID=36809 RepID=UPI0009A89CD9|nr:hypothetical protein [Mycobacteroides abscessus]SKK91248.1 Uncharacterised protein [Mycobacteroides abscessus subsp. massiliense]
MRYFFEHSISRPPTAREREVLTLRLARLKAMEQSAVDATAKLQELVEHRASPPGDLRIRHEFIRLPNAPSTADMTSRRGTERYERPPSTRVLSPRGIALSFILTTLLDAQMRLLPGQIAAPNERAIKAGTHHDGWTNYVATDAQVADKGKVFKTVRAKKVRQIQSGLVRLADEKLIHLPRDARGQRDYDRFTLLRDDARPTGDNDEYKVPDVEADYFTVPLTLFTNGWIHVLEDSELVLLLITARFHRKYGDTPQPMSSGPRKLNYGLTKDSYESAHRILDYLKIISVIADWNRTSDGKVSAIRERGAQPHHLRFHPDMLERPAYPTIVDTLTQQIARSEAS